MKKTKERFVTHDEFTQAFNHAWQNEMQRCLYSGMLGYVEFGNEFDLRFDSTLMNDTSSVQKNRLKDKK